MKSWPSVKLGTLAEFKNGLNYSKDNWGTGLKVIGVADFKDYLYPRYDELEEINPAGVVRDQDYLEEDDILFVRSNGNRELIGRCLYIKELPELMSHSGFTIRLRFTSDAVHIPFFVYLFRSSLIRSVLSIYGGGTNINNLNQGILSDLDVPLPPMEVQRKVAAVLVAYDELIQNNRRQVELLEEAAAEIYREWFVRMRYPGHQGDIGTDLPDGWALRPFSDLVHLKPREAMYDGEEKPYVGMDRLSEFSMYFTSDEIRTGKSGSKFRNGDVLFPRITPSVENGKRGYVMSLPEDVVGLGSTEFIVLREKDISAEHIYFITCDPAFRKHAELSMVGASGRQRVQEDCFEFFFVKTPPQKLRDSFSKTVGSHFQQVKVLQDQIQSCKLGRDLLIGRLLSKKFDITELAIEFPACMSDITPPDDCVKELAHA